VGKSIKSQSTGRNI